MIHAVESLDEIQKILETKDKLIILNFHSETCGPCIMQMPILEDLSNDLNIMLLTYDVDLDDEAVRHYKVSATPTSMIFKNGKQLFTHVGFLPYDKWNEEISKYQ
ncbi:MAG: thioredoxin family protein [Metamycoplasmataceae bacterium]